jgi:hypothetical protein
MNDFLSQNQDFEVYTDIDSPVFTIKLDLSISNALKYNNPVPVCSDEFEQGSKFWKLLGFARVYEEDHILVADLFLDFSISERLDLENGIKYLAYPEIAGNYIHRIFLTKE